MLFKFTLNICVFLVKILLVFHLELLLNKKHKRDLRLQFFTLRIIQLGQLSYYTCHKRVAQWVFVRTSQLDELLGWVLLWLSVC